MKKLILIVFLLAGLMIPASAQDYTPPQAPDGAAALLPPDRDTFGEGLWYVITSAFALLQPQTDINIKKHIIRLNNLFIFLLRIIKGFSLIILFTTF